MRLLKIDWSGHWTRPWPGYLAYIFERAMDEYRVGIADALYQPNPLYAMLTEDR